MAKDLKKLVGNRAAAFRRARRITQQDLAERIDRAWETISNFERGQSFPNLDTLAAIAKALGIGVSELFEDVEGECSLRRAQKEAAVRAMIKELSDAELDMVATQIEALVRRR